MGMFMFIDEDAILEGKQADEYKRRKKNAERESDREFVKTLDKYEGKRFQSLDRNDNSRQHLNALSSKSEKEYKNKERAAKAVNDEENKRIKKAMSDGDMKHYKNFSGELNKQIAADAYRRHARRHPKNESFFESIEMI